jgi:uncharacterized protein (TIGR02271 family)
MSRIITAFYDSAAEAQQAVKDLVAGGIPRGQITLSDRTTSATTSDDDGGHGFWHALKELFIPDEDQHTYAEGISRGGTLLSVRVDDNQIDRATDILDRTGAVDVDTRRAEWQSAGWSGYRADAGMQSGSVRADVGTGRDVAAGEEARIPIVEEQLAVGKREVDRGSVRVRSYVVETPVREQVTLRDESVTVEHRAVDRPADEGAAPLFQEKVIEVAETDEEAVVAKTARVREEVVVRKDVDQRTETIQDNVRRTEVEIDDTRTGRDNSTSDTSRRS